MIHRFLALVLIAAFAVTLGNAQTAKKPSKIVGEVIDVVTYVTNGMKPNNADRKALAESNAKVGNPLGILEKGTGKIYIIGKGQQGEDMVARLVPYFGLKIFAVGKVFKRGGINLLMLSDIGKSVK